MLVMCQGVKDTVKEGTTALRLLLVRAQNARVSKTLSVSLSLLLLLLLPPPQTDHLFSEHWGSFLAALNNSKGPATVISTRKDRDLEGDDVWWKGWRLAWAGEAPPMQNKEAGEKRVGSNSSELLVQAKVRSQHCAVGAASVCVCVCACLMRRVIDGGGRRLLGRLHDKIT